MGAAVVSKAKSWANPHPLMFVGGSEDYLVGREVGRARAAARTFGRRVVCASSAGEVRDATDEADTFGQPVLLLVEGASTLPAPVVEEFAARTDNVATLVVVHEGEVNPDKFPCPSVLPPYRLVFNRPSSRKDRESVARKFVGEEVARAKMTITEQVSEALVYLVGDDLGTLAQEVMKATTLARARAITVLDASLFREVIRPAAEVDLRPVTAALATRDRVGLTKSLHRLRTASEGSGDPLMLVLKAKGGPADQALTWLQVAHLLDSGATVEEISSRLVAPKWAVEKDLVPTAKRWGVPALSRLVSGLARAEGALLRGAPSPWNALVATLLLSCDPKSPFPVEPR
jgi:hypothetical protein